jgi:hypothetical protein
MLKSPLATQQRAGTLGSGHRAEAATALRNLIAAAEHGLATCCNPAWPSAAEAASAAAAKAREERMCKK